MAPRGSRFIFLDKGHPVKNAPVHGGQDASLFDRSIPGVKPQPGKVYLLHFLCMGQHGKALTIEDMHPAKLVLFQRETDFLPVLEKTGFFAVIITVALIKMAEEAALYTLFGDHHFKGAFGKAFQGQV